jgi:uncharacterized protein YycO
VKAWSFATGDKKEVWAEVKDGAGNSALDHKNITAVPEWRKDIQPGDIMLHRAAGELAYLLYWTHAGIYIGNNTVVEARAEKDGGINYYPITDWDYPKDVMVALLRVSNASIVQRTSAAEWAKAQVERKPRPTYMINMIDKSYDVNAPNWYCSELVWASYFNQGINVDVDNTTRFDPVTPDDIYLDNDVQQIGSHIEGNPEGHIAFSVIAKSPVDLVITSPSGLIISKESNEIPNSAYLLYDIDKNGSLEDIVLFGERVSGDYLINVIPDSAATPDSTYSLELSVNGQVTTLADHVRVSDIPTQGYILESAENGITSWSYSFTDQTRNTKLYINTDNQTFQFVAPDKEFPIKKATRMKIIDFSKEKEPPVKYDSFNKKWELDGKKLDLDNDLKPFTEQHQFNQRPDKIILINHKDSDLQLSAVVVDGKEDSCVAMARDLKTKKVYLLTVKPEFKRFPKKK